MLPLFPIRVLPGLLVLSLLVLATPGAAAPRPPRRPAAPVKAAPRPARPPQKKLSPAEAERLYDEALAQVGREQYDEAIAAFQLYFDSTRNPKGLFSLAGTLKKAGRAAEAMAAYERTLLETQAADPLHAMASKSLGELRKRQMEEEAGQLYAERKYAEAAAAYEALHKLRPAAQTLFLAATAYRQAGRDAEAISAYERSLQGDLSPAQREEAERSLTELRSRTTAARARELEEAQRPAEAAKTWLLAYKYRADPELLFRAAQAQRRARQYAEALRSFGRYLEEDPQTPHRAEVEAGRAEVRALIEAERAQRLLADKKIAPALRAWDEAYAIRPLPEFLLEQGRVLRRARRHKEALPKFERYLQEERTPAPERAQEAQQAIAELRELLGAEDRALSLAEQSRRPPAYRRGWFVALMSGAALLVGGAVATAVLVPHFTAPRPVPADLGVIDIGPAAALSLGGAP